MADTVALYALLVALALLAWRFAASVHPDRVADVGWLASSVVLLFVLPLLGTHWLIGFVTYLNHTHPDIVWFDDPAEWSSARVQLEGSTALRVEGPWRLALPHRMLNHTAHHVDPGVPLRSLRDAQAQIMETAGDRVVAWSWSERRFRDVLAQCALYDDGDRRWLGFAAAEEPS